MLPSEATACPAELASPSRKEIRIFPCPSPTRSRSPLLALRSMDAHALKIEPGKSRSQLFQILRQLEVKAGQQQDSGAEFRLLGNSGQRDRETWATTVGRH